VGSEFHLIARDIGFMLGELFCVAAILHDMHEHSRQCGRPLLGLYPHFLPKIALTCALMWLALSFTTFKEA
jgi:hypothetical protein